MKFHLAVMFVFAMVMIFIQTFQICSLQFAVLNKLVFRSLVNDFLCSAIVIFSIKEVWQFSALK